MLFLFFFTHSLSLFVFHSILSCKTRSHPLFSFAFGLSICRPVPLCLCFSVIHSCTHIKNAHDTHKHLGCSSAGDTAQTAAAALINDLVLCVYCMATLTECRRGSGAVNLINLSFFLFLWLARPFSLPSYRMLMFGTGARGFTNPELFPVAVHVFLLCCLDRYPPPINLMGSYWPCQRFVSRIARCCTNLWKYSLKGECCYNEC